MNVNNQNADVKIPHTCNENLKTSSASSLNLFVKNLAPETTSGEFFDLFKEFGDIHSIKLKLGEDGKCLGYGYVMFNSSEDAKKAKEKINGQIFKEKELMIENFHNFRERYSSLTGNQESNSNFNENNFNISTQYDWQNKIESYKTKYENCNLIVKNLPKEMGNKELFEIFSNFGAVTSAKVATKGVFKEKISEGIIVDKEFAYESKGYGYVCFRKPEDAQMAINEMFGKSLVHKDQEYKLAIEVFNYDRVGTAKNAGGNVNLPSTKNKIKTEKRNKQVNVHRNTVFNPMFYPQENSTFDFRNENVQKIQKVENFQNIQKVQKKAHLPVSSESTFLFTNFLREFYPIFNLAESPAKTEQLGEKIFFFLMNYIPLSKGLIDLASILTSIRLEDLCSRLTGIFIYAERQTLAELFNSEENLINTLNDLIIKLIKKT
jgi:RNA recognition motif-containing protein